MGIHNALGCKQLLVSSFIAFMLIAACSSSTFLEHVHMNVTESVIREGVRFKVFCWWDALSAMEQVCDSLDQLYMSVQTGIKLETKIFNGTGIYHEETSAVAKHTQTPYNCMCKGRSLSASTFMIGLKLNITNFKCFFFDAKVDEVVKCNFSTPLNTFEIDQSTTFDLLYENQLASCKKESDINESHILCEVKNFNKFSNFSFQLRMNDSLGTQIQNILLSKGENIILDMPAVQVVNISSNSICLHWHDIQESNHDGHNITISVELSPSDKHMTPIVNVLEKQLCLMNLSYPYYDYSLKLRRRYNETGAVWGTPYVHNFTTDPSIPSRPPTAWPGGYHFNIRKPDELRVYWQEVLLLEQNGPNFKYNLEVRNVQSKTQVTNSAIKVESNMAVISNVQANVRYEMTIRSQNSEGMSINSSSLTIVSEKGMQRRIPSGLKMNATTLSWQAPDDQNELCYYTIYLCTPNPKDLTRCDNATPIKTIQVNAQTNFYEIKLNDSLKWAISASYNGEILSGGMIWFSTENPIYVYADSHRTEVLLALLVLGFCSYLLYRKVAYMSDIKVDLPDGVLSPRDEHTDSSNTECHSVKPEEIPLVLPLNVKPLEIERKQNSKPVTGLVTTQTECHSVIPMEIPLTGAAKVKPLEIENIEETPTTVTGAYTPDLHTLLPTTNVATKETTGYVECNLYPHINPTSNNYVPMQKKQDFGYVPVNSFR